MIPLSKRRVPVEILGRLWVCPPMPRRPQTPLFALVFCRPPDALAFRIRGGPRQWAYRQPEGE